MPRLLNIILNFNLYIARFTPKPPVSLIQSCTVSRR